jgi:LDH2 family malate/lactate/ureidoglycolate dehydrogenase
MLVSAPSLTDWCAVAFRAAGMPETDARLTAESLVEADLRGVESHGVMRVPIYIERLTRGVIEPVPAIRTVRQTRSTAVVDGGNGMGQVVGVFAMSVAIEKAALENEPAFVSVFNSNHFGAAAYFVEMASRRNMIGFAYTISGINHMVPWGGAEAMLGNNPFAVAMPIAGSDPMVLDMACSVAARGKIIVAAKEGRAIPADWAVNAAGQPTTDASEALGGFMSPVGGPKGYALTLTIGLLSTMLSGASFGREVTHQYEDFDNPQNIGHLFGVLPIAAFEEEATYATRMSKAASEIRGARRASGVDRLYLPGEREAELLQFRSRAGIPLSPEVRRDLDAVALKLGILKL